MDKFVYYPNIDNDKLQSTIFSKKEFYDQRISENFLNKKSEYICKDIVPFSLQNHQTFVKNYMSGETPYNSILLMHETGTGKTCTAIQIAENFKKTVNKIYIVSLRSILDNFKKNLYDYSKELIEKKNKMVPGSKQCTGSEYYISEDIINREDLIKEKISEKYTFLTWDGFSKLIIRSKKSHTLKKRFTNCMFFFDEVHSKTIIPDEKLTLKYIDLHNKIPSFDPGILNVLSNINEKEVDTLFNNIVSVIIKKKAATKNRKKITKLTYSLFLNLLTNILDNETPEIIEKIVYIINNTNINKSEKDINIIQYMLHTGINNKLVLMTATPIWNDIEGIVDIINLLRINDNKSVIHISDIFGHNEINYENIKKYFNGYVSYVRGNIPNIFPRLYESYEVSRNNHNITYYTPKPKYDFRGNIIDDHIKHNKFIRCPMSEYHLSHYVKLLDLPTSVIEQNMIIASNIAYPLPEVSKKSSSETHEEINIDMAASNIFGDQGFDRIFKLYMNKYTSTISNDWMKMENIGTYSTKFKLLLQNLDNPGMSIIYTDRVNTGAKTISMILEMNGYDSYTSNFLKYKLPDKYKRCAICNNEKINHQTKDDDHKFIQAKYIVFHGKGEQISTKILNILNSPENSYGKIIKVIIGTLVIIQGIDFKNIRTVHLINHWFNLTRLEQIIGRAVRFCSHHTLPKKDQEVILYRYSMTMPRADEVKRKYPSKIHKMETHDEKSYRISENKDKVIRKIMRVMKRNAIDCLLNKFSNTFSKSGYGVDYQRNCDYEKCDYSCYDKTKFSEVNYDTFRLNFTQNRINNIKYKISEIYKQKYFYTLDEIVKILSNYMKLEGIYINIQDIYMALDELVINIDDEKYINSNIHIDKYKDKLIMDTYNRPGYILYAYPYYIYHPANISNLQLPIFYKSTLPPIHENISINTIYQNLHPLLHISAKKDAVALETQLKKKLDITILHEKLMLNEIPDSKIEFQIFIDRISSKNLVKIFEYYINTNEINIKDTDYFTTELYRYLNYVGIVNIINSKFYHNINNAVKYLNSENVWVNGDINKWTKRKPNKLSLVEPSKKIYGFYTFDCPSGSSNKQGCFKIVMKELEKKVDSKKKKGMRIGQLCYTISKTMLEKTASHILSKEELVSMRKLSNNDERCLMIERRLRLFDLRQKENSRWFYSSHTPLQQS